MPKAAIRVDKVEVKEGTSKKTGKPYRMVVLTDGNGERYSSFEVGMYEIARQYEGKQALIDWESNGTFKDLLSVKPGEDDEVPKLGSGDYIRGQTAPNDKISIHASVALKEAIATFEDFPLAAGDKPAEIYKLVAPLADLYFVWLQRKSGFQIDDEDIPF